MAIRSADVNAEYCVACGACMKVCPRDAILVFHGKYAVASKDLCVGCGRCEKTCPAGAINILEGNTV
jgi:ferredoxin